MAGFVRKKCAFRARFRKLVRAFLAFSHTFEKRTSNHCFPLMFFIFKKETQDFRIRFKNTCVKVKQKSKINRPLD